MDHLSTGGKLAICKPRSSLKRHCHAQHALQVWNRCIAEVTAAVRFASLRCQRLYCCPQALYAHSALAAPASYNFVSVVGSRHAAESRPARRRSRQAQSAEEEPAHKRSCTSWLDTASTTAAEWHWLQSFQAFAQRKLFKRTGSCERHRPHEWKCAYKQHNKSTSHRSCLQQPCHFCSNQKVLMCCLLLL